MSDFKRYRELRVKYKGKELLLVKEFVELENELKSTHKSHDREREEIHEMWRDDLKNKRRHIQLVENQLTQAKEVIRDLYDYSGCECISDCDCDINWFVEFREKHDSNPLVIEAMRGKDDTK